ncbi:AMP-binding protein [Aminiphilus sp.]|uniref:AMP-binding protein n=1 Tax=Aminiphilus sp. TaxID=1872488 RepID=UPI0026322150|nr:AMP-binding protein [Aminiphilus sp.]
MRKRERVATDPDDLGARLEERIGERMAANPEENCLWWKGTWWTRRRFEEEVARCTESLRASGFREGSRIAFFLPTSPLVLVLSVAAWRLRGTVVPLNARAGHEASLRILNLVDPEGVVFTEDLEDLHDTVANAGFPVAVASPEGPLPPLRKREGEAVPKRTPPTPTEPSVAVIFATSGTTGNPKAVPISHGNLLDNTRHTAENVECFAPGNILMNVLPNFHTLGYSVCGVLSLLFDIPQVLLPSFMPIKATLEAMEATGTTLLVAVPTMLSFLLGAIAKGEPVPPSLKNVLTGGGKLDPELDRRLREHLGLAIVEGYGLTECSPVVSCNPSLATRKLGTVGPALPGYELQIRSVEGKLLTLADEGVLWVKSPSVAEGYFRAPDMTAERFQDGWFNTGDIVRIDEDGYISIIDRASDLIIVGGFNVYPQEVETVLQEHRSVRMAGAVGAKHRLTGEVVAAFVVPDPDNPPSQQELIRHCKERLAHYKVPRKLEFVESLPLSATGKVLRRELRKMAGVIGD